MVDGINLESLGFTKEELQERVIERIVDKFLTDRICGEDGEYLGDSQIARKLQEAIKDKTREAVATIAEKQVLPKISTHIENLVLTETNTWGESKSEYTFREYLVRECERWMTEKVNFEGKSKSQCSFSFSASQTRLAHMVHQHLHYEIDKAVKGALSDINSRLSSGLVDTVKIKLNDALKSMNVNVSLK